MVESGINMVLSPLHDKEPVLFQLKKNFTAF